MTHIFDRPHPRVLGHRGTTVHAPENTAAAFIYAGEHRAWAIETDLRLTKDEEIVCIHNSTVDAQYDSTGKVDEFTLAEIRELKNRHTVFGLSQELSCVPTFEEYLDICESYGCIPFIEIKESRTIARTVEILKARGLLGRSVISSAKLKHLKMTRELTDEVFIHHIFSDLESAEELSLLGNAGLSFKIADPDEVPTGLVESIHTMGLRMCIRAADTQEALQKMLHLGLDYIPSNCIYGYENE